MQEPRFHTKDDRTREDKALDLYCLHLCELDTYHMAYESDGSYDAQQYQFVMSFTKLDDMVGVDAMIYRDKEPLCYAEVKGVNKYIADAVTVPLSIRKMHNVEQFIKGTQKGYPPLKAVVIWAFRDGIGYREYDELTGFFESGGSGQSVIRVGALYDIEQMAYIEKQHLRLVKYKEIV